MGQEETPRLQVLLDEAITSSESLIKAREQANEAVNRRIVSWNELFSYLDQIAQANSIYEVDGIEWRLERLKATDVPYSYDTTR
jgi:hypothetical protein